MICFLCANSPFDLKKKWCMWNLFMFGSWSDCCLHIGPWQAIWSYLFSNLSYLAVQQLCLFEVWALRWRHNERDSVSNHQPRDCLLNCLFRRRSKKTSKLRVTGLCVGNSPGTGEFPAQMASNAENVSIWWRHHGKVAVLCFQFEYIFLWFRINISYIVPIFLFR